MWKERRRLERRWMGRRCGEVLAPQRILAWAPTSVWLLAPPLDPRTLHLLLHCEGTECCCQKYSSSSQLSVFPLDRQDKVYVATLHYFISSVSHVWLCFLSRSQSLAVPVFCHRLSENWVACVDIYIFLFQIFLLKVCLSFFLLLSSSTPSGITEQLADGEREGGEAVGGRKCRTGRQRPLRGLEHESICEGPAVFVGPSIHLPLCFHYPSMCPSSHAFSSQEKYPASTFLEVQTSLLDSSFLDSLQREEWVGVWARQRQDMRIDYLREFTLSLLLPSLHPVLPPSLLLSESEEMTSQSSFCHCMCSHKIYKEGGREWWRAGQMKGERCIDAGKESIWSR